MFMQKMNTVKSTLSLILFIIILYSDLSAVEIKEWAVALNLSGRQRMLSQKMAKEFLLIKLDIEKSENEQLLLKTMKMFERTLDQLIIGDKDLSIPAAPNNEILNQLRKVKMLWSDYKKALEDNDIEKVAKLNLPVLENMHKAVGLYEEASIKAGIKNSGTVINVAGRQRMLTQKMSKEIFLIALGIDKEANLKALEDTQNLFNKSLYGLIEGNSEMNLPPTTNTRNLNQMRKVEKLWIPFKKHVEMVVASTTTSRTQLKYIYEKNTTLLNEMNRAVKFYEVSAK